MSKRGRTGGAYSSALNWCQTEENRRSVGELHVGWVGNPRSRFLVLTLSGKVPFRSGFGHIDLGEKGLLRRPLFIKVPVFLPLSPQPVVLVSNPGALRG